MLSEALAYLHEDDYAKEFYRLTGRYPRWVPTSGEWPYTERKWRTYTSDDTRRASEGEGEAPSQAI